MKPTPVFKMKSGVSWWLFGPVLAAVCVSAYYHALEEIQSLWLYATVLAFIVSLLFGTNYTIYSDGRLGIVSGIIPFGKVSIAELTEVRYTFNPISSPALSMKRLALYKNGRLHVIISPENR